MKSWTMGWRAGRAVGGWLLLTFVLTLMLLESAQAAPGSGKALRMRPYAGIGVLVLVINTSADAEPQEPFLLYEEPAVSRLGELSLNSGTPPFDWIFGVSRHSLPLIVMARKGNWLRVTYDDAGREAWLTPGRRGVFLPWEQFCKRHTVRLLPGLQKKYYALSHQPGGAVLATLTAKQSFKVLRVESDWAMVMLDQKNLGWLRWRDEDGRLLLSLERSGP